MRSVPRPRRPFADAIATAARDVAETLDLKAIVAWTSSGSTAFRIARERPEPPVLALTPNRDTARRLALVWGVHAVVTEDAQDVDDMAERACVISAAEGFAAAGDRIIIVAGVPLRLARRDQYGSDRPSREVERAPTSVIASEAKQSRDIHGLLRR